MEDSENINDKKRPIHESNMDSDESSSDTDMESDVASDDEQEEEQHINIEFEAQTPVEEDFHGIKQLLIRSFLLQHVDLSELTDLLISQTNVGSTVKIVDDEENEVYGITSILSLKKHEEKSCVKDLKKGLLTKCKSSAADKCHNFETILEKKNVGFIINERFINVPPQIAVPFHKSLRTEVEEAISEDSSFNFDYLLLVSKTLKPTKLPDTAQGSGGTSKSKKKKKKRQEMNPDEIEYTNFEDEMFHKACEISFSYSVTEATGLAIGGSWDFGDQLMNTYRTVMLIPQTKWKQIINDVEGLLEQ